MTSLTKRKLKARKAAGKTVKVAKPKPVTLASMRKAYWPRYYYDRTFGIWWEVREDKTVTRVSASGIVRPTTDPPNAATFTVSSEYYEVPRPGSMIRLNTRDHISPGF